jgi:large repetitive protein
VTTAIISQVYSYTVEATGYPAPSFALVESVPDGMSIDAISGLITWTPTAPGHVEVTVQATNSAGVASQRFTIDVTEAPAITSTAVTTAIISQVYSYTVEATGYPAPSFGLAEPVPDGMNIDAASGLITWTPTASGHVEVTVQATNSVGATSQSFTIDVMQLPVITSTAVTTAMVSQVYSYMVEATGYPTPSLALVEPVPDGMSIDPASGLITWTPAAPGHVEVTVQATNSAGVASQRFTIDVNKRAVEAPSFTLYLALIVSHND